MWSSKLILLPCENPPPPPKKKKEKKELTPLDGSGRCAMGWEILLCYWLGSSTSREGSTLHISGFFADISHSPPPSPLNELAPPEWAREMRNPLTNPMVTLVWLQHAQGSLFTEQQNTFLVPSFPQIRTVPSGTS